jgi:ADP-ribosylglycohydrolase
VSSRTDFYSSKEKMESNTKFETVNSALWAAYGDALGFITELADSRTLAFRLEATTVTKTVEWKRRIGGRFGPTMHLPAGCYSDDTQLRLSTSRAIRADGHFDVEAFAKVELPVWLSYALGGGLSTKAAAALLSRDNVNWFSNFFSTNKSDYFDAGGNGAAMRIQPHVWAASNPADSATYMHDVIRNTICTHGNPNAISGAYFHAKSLAYVLVNKKVPSPNEWRAIVSELNEVLRIIAKDDDLNTFWMPVWKQRTKGDVEDLFRRVEHESMQDIDSVEKELVREDSGTYPRVVKAIGGLEPSTRGSGIKTAILAAALSWLFRNKETAEALAMASNILGSDTDTIASMAGALLGAADKRQPPGNLADRGYIEEEARRLYAVSKGTAQDSFRYPDLMSWKPPKTPLATVEKKNGKITVAGLGTAEPVGRPIEDRKEGGAAWQWLKLSFNQTILAKHRLNPISGREEQLVNTVGSNQQSKGSVEMDRQKDMFNRPREVKKDDQLSQMPQRASLDELTNAAINSGFNQQLIGKHLVELAESADGVELAIAYSAIIVKAKRARLRVQGK